MDNLIFALNVVSPVFLIIMLGIVLRLTGQVNDNFISTSSNIVFNFSMPALVFKELSTANLTETFQLRQIVFIYVGMTIFFILTWLLSTFVTNNGRDRGAFIQGSIRSNYAIVGFAIIFNMFGSEGLSKASIFLAFVMPFYNLLAVIALTVPVNKEREIGIAKTAIKIITNPLILAVCVAIPVSFLKINIPLFLNKSINYLAAMTLPLALLGIGGSLNFSTIKKDSRLALIATVIKIIFIPIILTFIAYKLGYQGVDLGVMYILFATPTAIASFIMAKAMNCNADLAGNIIVMSTLGSVVTISFGIFLLKSLGIF